VHAREQVNNVVMKNTQAVLVTVSCNRLNTICYGIACGYIVAWLLNSIQSNVHAREQVNNVVMNKHPGSVSYNVMQQIKYDF